MTIDVNTLKPAQLQKLAKEHGVPWGPIPVVKKKLAEVLAKAKPAKPAKEAAKPTPAAKPTKPAKKVEPEPEEEEEEEPAPKPKKAKAPEAPAESAEVAKLRAMAAKLGFDLAKAGTVEATSEVRIPKSIKDFVKQVGAGYELHISSDQLDEATEEQLRELLKVVRVDDSDVKAGQVRALRARLREALDTTAAKPKKAAAPDDDDDDDDGEEIEEEDETEEVKTFHGFTVGDVLVWNDGETDHKAIVVDPDELGEAKLSKKLVRVMFPDDEEEDSWADVEPGDLTQPKKKAKKEAAKPVATGKKKPAVASDDEDDEEEDADDEE